MTQEPVRDPMQSPPRSLAQAPRFHPGRQMRWVWLSLLPLALGAWVPLFVGMVERRRLFALAGLAWSALAVVAWVMASGRGTNDAAGGLIILAWVGAFVTSLAQRAVIRRDDGSAFDAAVDQGRERLRARAHARRIAQEQPALAREMGIGRPDLPGAQDAGLIDVNHVPASVLASLPGVGDTLAQRIVAARDEIHGWSSLEDMGSEMDLDGNLVEDIRDHVIFLPS